MDVHLVKGMPSSVVSENLRFLLQKLRKTFGDLKHGSISSKQYILEINIHVSTNKKVWIYLVCSFF